MSKFNELILKSSVPVAQIAEQLATASDKEQIEFFNTFIYYMTKNCETNFRYELQLGAIHEGLANVTKDACKFLGANDD